MDAATSKQTEETLLGFIDKGERRLVLDMSQLDYISSIGLRVFILVAKRLKTVNGQVVVCALQPGVQQIFDIAGFNTIFKAYPTRAEAVSAAV
jgi:stage II sporulation protein AA (anti-sigma F factor antagonist)